MEEVIEEELTALEAIFYDSYSKISENSFRVRIDPDVEEEEGTDAPPPLFLEFLLPEGYPQILPKFDLSNLNNSNYPDTVKAAMLEGLQEQVYYPHTGLSQSGHTFMPVTLDMSKAEEQKGESMCYNLVEWLKEKLPVYYAQKRITAMQDSDHSDSHEQRQVMGAGRKDASGKEKMTKAQKRRHFDKFGAGSEKPRGWDWVPILSHLGQVPHGL